MSKLDSTVKIWFDGGCKGNPGSKYGSWKAELNGAEILQHSRFEFGHGTNNEAEFNALAMAVAHTMAWLEDKGLNKADYELSIWTDSTIVRNRLTQKNAVFKKYPSSVRMFSLAVQCLGLLKQFKSFQVEWEGRENNVSRFGH